MIKKIKFDNFYSFKNEQVIDFTTSKKKSDDYYQSFDGKQISKVASFIGANASGKTNVMKLLGFFQYFLTVSKREKENIYDLGFKSYAFDKSNSNSNFYIEFETEKNIFIYKLTATSKKIIEEKLIVKKIEKKSKPVIVFSRNNNKIIINKKIEGITSKNLSTIRQDVSLVSFINSNYNVDIIKEVYNYFINSFTINVNEKGIIRTPESKIKKLIDLYNKIPGVKKEVAKFIKNFDIGIDDIKIKKLDEKEEIYLFHKAAEGEYELPFAYESHGTKIVIAELPLILGFHNFGNLLIFDEIESGLHPEATNKIIQYLIDNLGDTKKQFIFSSNYIEFLKKFDAQQIFLVEKENNLSNITRLDTLDIRSDDNFYSKYMTGAYGAFPNIKI